MVRAAFEPSRRDARRRLHRLAQTQPHFVDRMEPPWTCLSRVFAGYDATVSTANLGDGGTAEEAALVRRARMQLRRAQELHADLKTLMAQVDRLARRHQSPEVAADLRPLKC